MKNFDQLKAFATENADQTVGGASYSSIFMAPGPIAGQQGFQTRSMAPGPLLGLQGVSSQPARRSTNNFFFARSSRNAGLGPFL